MTPTRLASTLALLLLPSLAPAATYRASLTTDWTENLSRSSSARDWQDVLTLHADATAAWSRQLTGNLTLITEVEAAAQLAPDFSQLSQGELTLRAEARRKFGLGPLAPTLAGRLALTGRAAGIEQDNGLTQHLALQAGKRLTESWRIAATAETWKHHARTDAFDISYRRYFGEVSWDITERWQLSSGYGRFNGSFTANASAFVWNRALTGLLGPAIQEYYTITPQAVTDSYGPGWVTYKVHGTARYWWLQLSPALSDTTTITLRYENTLMKNIVNVKYRQLSWSAALVHRF
ncbi:MAG: hypothetical protein NDI75_11300 [Candidatus Didemnitutus sp.]|nr:hypothetical protein [Candidatus Didemnitutus sp.]